MPDVDLQCRLTAMGWNSREDVPYRELGIWEKTPEITGDIQSCCGCCALSLCLLRVAHEGGVVARGALSAGLCGCLTLGALRRCPVLLKEMIDALSRLMTAFYYLFILQKISRTSLFQESEFQVPCLVFLVAG